MSTIEQLASLENSYMQELRGEQKKSVRIGAKEDKLVNDLLIINSAKLELSDKDYQLSLTDILLNRVRKDGFTEESLDTILIINKYQEENQYLTNYLKNVQGNLNKATEKEHVFMETRNLPDYLVDRINRLTKEESQELLNILISLNYIKSDMYPLTDVKIKTKELKEKLNTLTIKVNNRLKDKELTYTDKYDIITDTIETI